jgi:rhamnosyltransferase subunit B
LPSPTSPRRILFATIGSLGDLHPCLALALELQRRGHHVTIAATEIYRPRIESLGITFHPMRPHWDPADREIIRRCSDLKRGLEVLYRELMLPHLKETYEDLLPIAAQSDLLIAGELVYAAPLVAEKLNSRWVSLLLSPLSFFSAHDPSMTVNLPLLIHLRKLGPSAYRLGLDTCRLAVRHWSNPVRQLRREQGLRAQCDPVFKDKFSPYLVLALFSSCLAAPQPDWPPQTKQPGFIFFDSHWHDAAHPAQLAKFLAAGDPPVVFTQGSTVAHDPGKFYEVSAEAATRLGRRAVLIGIDSLPGENSPNLLALRYAPYSEIFPHGSVIVHQGGVGTTGQALRAGRPMLIVPYGWDQPDNAMRVERLGAGLHIRRTKYTAKSAAAAINRLFTEPSFPTRAGEAAACIHRESALSSAINSIESLLPRP